MLFLTYSWRFLRSNTLEQVEFKVEKIIDIQKPTEKVRKKTTIPTIYSRHKHLRKHPHMTSDFRVGRLEKA